MSRFLLKEVPPNPYAEMMDEHDEPFGEKSTYSGIVVEDDGKPKLVFSDAHTPFDHPGYLPFLVDTYKRYGCGQTLNLGDQTDQHMFSRFKPEAIAKGAVEEYTAARKKSRKYFDAFENGYLCVSNHDLRFIRKAAEVGVPEFFMRTFGDLYGVPKTWQIGETITINNVLYMHGEGWGDQDGARKAAKQNGMSVCLGHFHSKAGCDYVANERNLWFGMYVGCGVDRKAYALAYAKNDKEKQILGCGIVYDSKHAEFVPMGESYFRSYHK